LHWLTYYIYIHQFAIPSTFLFLLLLLLLYFSLCYQLDLTVAIFVRLYRISLYIYIYTYIKSWLRFSPVFLFQWIKEDFFLFVKTRQRLNDQFVKLKLFEIKQSRVDRMISTIPIILYHSRHRCCYFIYIYLI
jgi:hypothetical protein